MKGGTLPATFEKLGVTSSYSRPRVSNDNAYIDSLFGTTKQRPEYPPEGFKSLDLARDWVTMFIAVSNSAKSGQNSPLLTPVQISESTSLFQVSLEHYKSKR